MDVAYEVSGDVEDVGGHNDGGIQFAIQMQGRLSEIVRFCTLLSHDVVLLTSNFFLGYLVTLESNIPNSDIEVISA